MATTHWPMPTREESPSGRGVRSRPDGSTRSTATSVVWSIAEDARLDLVAGLARLVPEGDGHRRRVLPALGHDVRVGQDGALLVDDEAAPERLSCAARARGAVEASPGRGPRRRRFCGRSPPARSPRTGRRAAPWPPAESLRPGWGWRRRSRRPGSARRRRRTRAARSRPAPRWSCSVNRYLAARDMGPHLPLGFPGSPAGTHRAVHPRQVARRCSAHAARRLPASSPPTSSSSAAVSAQAPAAAASARTWSGEVAPAITEATGVCAARYESESSSSVWPCASAIRGEALHGVELPVVDDVLRRPSVAAEPRTTRRRPPSPVRAAQQAGGERIVGHERHAQAHGRRQDAAAAHAAVLGLALEQAVLVLDHGEAAQPPPGRRRGGLFELRGREVGAADLAHQAAGEQAVHHLERLRQRRPGVGLVVVEEVEVVRAQAAQAGLERPRHPLGLPSAAQGRAVVAELGGDDHLVAAPPSARPRYSSDSPSP